MIESLIQTLEAGQELSADQMSASVDLMMTGHLDEASTASFLTALANKGETTTEVAGAARAMRRHMVAVRGGSRDLVDTCGTGGDGSGTFNISTAAALVTAAAGTPVAKHGNRSITSKSGSADVLERLGVRIDAPLDVVERCLETLDICFCFAPQLHPAMKHVAPVRRRLGFPTIFNLLGPLCNPASAPFQLLGTGRHAMRQKLAGALALLGTTRSVIVTGDDGLDEVTLGTTTRVSLVEGPRIVELEWNPEGFGLASADHEALAASDPQASAEMIREVLGGGSGPPRDIVVANAGAALWVAGRADALAECALLAAQAIDDGRASRLLEQLGELSHA